MWGVTVGRQESWMQAEGDYSASARSPVCLHVVRNCPSGCATCRLVWLPVRKCHAHVPCRGLREGSGPAQPQYRVRKKQDVSGHHLRCSEVPSGDAPAPSPVLPWEVVHSFILPFLHKHMAWTVYMVHQGAGERQMVNFLFCEGYIYFFFTVFCAFVFSEVIFGVRFTFCFLFLSVAFPPLGRGWCRLFISCCDSALPWIQTVAFRTFQIFQKLPGLPAPPGGFCS